MNKKVLLLSVLLASGGAVVVNQQDTTVLNVKNVDLMSSYTSETQGEIKVSNPTDYPVTANYTSTSYIDTLT